MEIRMKINEYQELAMTTLNPELSKRDVLINSVMGLCGESWCWWYSYKKAIGSGAENTWLYGEYRADC